jgi:ribonucleoside-diphosphate reductase subunit M2
MTHEPLSNGLAIEPLLQPNPDRYVLFPIKYPSMWDYYKKMCGSLWTVEELQLSADRAHLETLTKDEQYYIKMILAFFNNFDLLIVDNLVNRFSQDLGHIPECTAFYAVQNFQEIIHSESYSMLLETLIPDVQEKYYLTHSIVTIPSVKRIGDWATRWLESTDSFAERLVAFACIEGIMFSGPFCAIFWFNERGVLPGVCQTNKLVQKDENMHCEFACLLYRDFIVHKPSLSRILEIVESCVDVECQFISAILPNNLVGMNAPLMQQYIRFVADRLLMLLGYDSHFKDQNPFTFMEKISLKTKTNFFEKTETEYSMSGFESGAQNNMRELRLVEDF